MCSQSRDSERLRGPRKHDLPSGLSALIKGADQQREAHRRSPESKPDQVPEPNPAPVVSTPVVKTTGPTRPQSEIDEMIDRMVIKTLIGIADEANRVYGHHVPRLHPSISDLERAVDKAAADGDIEAVRNRLKEYWDTTLRSLGIHRHGGNELMWTIWEKAS